MAIKLDVSKYLSNGSDGVGNATPSFKLDVSKYLTPMENKVENQIQEQPEDNYVTDYNKKIDKQTGQSIKPPVEEKQPIIKQSFSSKEVFIPKTIKPQEEGQSIDKNILKEQQKAEEPTLEQKTTEPIVKLKSEEDFNLMDKDLTWKPAEIENDSPIKRLFKTVGEKLNIIDTNEEKALKQDAQYKVEKELKKIGYNVTSKDVEKNFTEYKRIAFPDVEYDPTKMEVLEGLMGAGLIASVIMNPASVPVILKGIGTFAAVSEGINLGVSKLNKEQYKFAAGKGLQDIEAFKKAGINPEFLEFTDLLVKMGITGAFGKLYKNLFWQKVGDAQIKGANFIDSTKVTDKTGKAEIFNKTTLEGKQGQKLVITQDKNGIRGKLYVKETTLENMVNKLRTKKTATGEKINPFSLVENDLSQSMSKALQGKPIKANIVQDGIEFVLPAVANKVSEPVIQPDLTKLPTTNENVPSDIKSPLKRDYSGIVEEWGTKNQYLDKNPYKKKIDKGFDENGKYDLELLKKSSVWEMEQVLKDKPAFLTDDIIPYTRIMNFAKNNDLSYGFTKDNKIVIGKTKQDVNNVINAKNQRELGLALGYEDLMWEGVETNNLTPEQLKLFRTSDDGKIEFDTSKLEAQKIISEMFGDKYSQDFFKTYDKAIIDNNKIALGFYSNDFINLFENNQKVSSRATYHESFHKFYNTMLSKNEQQYLSSKYGDEEKLARDFEEFVIKEKNGKQKMNLIGRIRYIFEKLYNSIKNFLTGRKKIEKYFNDLLQGKYKEKEVSKGLTKYPKKKGVTFEEFERASKEGFNLGEERKSRQQKLDEIYKAKKRDSKEILKEIKDEKGKEFEQLKINRANELKQAKTHKEKIAIREKYDVLKKQMSDYNKVSLTLSKLFETNSQRLKDIALPIWRKAKRAEYDLIKKQNEDTSRVSNFLSNVLKAEKYKKNTDNWDTMLVAMRNGDETKVNEMADKVGISQKDIESWRKLANDIFERQVNVGYNVNFRQNYFPFMVKENMKDKWIINFDKKNNNAASNVIANAEKMYGRKLNDTEKINIINSIINHQYSEDNSLIQGTSFMKERQIDMRYNNYKKYKLI